MIFLKRNLCSPEFSGCLQEGWTTEVVQGGCLIKILQCKNIQIKLKQQWVHHSSPVWLQPNGTRWMASSPVMCATCGFRWKLAPHFTALTDGSLHSYRPLGAMFFSLLQYQENAPQVILTKYVMAFSTERGKTWICSLSACDLFAGFWFASTEAANMCVAPFTQNGRRTWEPFRIKAGAHLVQQPISHCSQPLTLESQQTGQQGLMWFHSARIQRFAASGYGESVQVVAVYGE